MAQESLELLSRDAALDIHSLLGSPNSLRNPAASPTDSRVPRTPLVNRSLTTVTDQSVPGTPAVESSSMASPVTPLPLTASTPVNRDTSRYRNTGHRRINQAYNSAFANLRSPTCMYSPQLDTDQMVPTTPAGLDYNRQECHTDNTSLRLVREQASRHAPKKKTESKRRRLFQEKIEDGGSLWSCNSKDYTASDEENTSHKGDKPSSSSQLQLFDGDDDDIFA